jgi:UDP-GlcNAc:undecaprenyl-phosphate GlcNAc-1-phosphate transferase
MIYLNGWSVPLTVAWIVVVVNTLNLIDGLDGLAAGVSSIAAATLLLLAWQAGQMHVAVITAALMGSSLGFLRYNFNPARIFMGDSGSMLLGFVLAAVSVEGALKSAATIALIVPILALGLPFIDTLFAVIRRLRSGRPIYEADRGHLHHRLMDMGLNQKQVVMVLYGISALLGFGAIAITSLEGYWPLFLVSALLGLCYLGARKINLFSTHHEK